jgi:NitT/TauT family transport system ATP-binding protein
MTASSTEYGPTLSDDGGDGGPKIAVTVENVSVRYDTGTLALDDFSLPIERGRTVGIVGPSGCGKSTLLYVLALLRKPTSGEIRWGVHPTNSHPLTMVFQKDTLYPWLTVRENVGIYYRFNRAPKKEVRARVDEMLQLVGLEQFGDFFPYQLSGGMRRRTAALAAIAPSPAVLLLDEPFSALDEPTRVAVQQDVFNLVRRAKTTVVLVTHDVAEAVSFCDEVIVLTAGPGKISSRHRIPFGDERELLQMRQHPDFLATYGTIWQELSLRISESRHGRRVS